MNWHLVNVVERSKVSKEFKIPSALRRRFQKSGSLVKIIFELDGSISQSSETEAERMWVEVISRKGSTYTGKLDNDPVIIGKLKVGDSVSFGPEHIAAVWDE